MRDACLQLQVTIFRNGEHVLLLLLPTALSADSEIHELANNSFSIQM